MPHRTDDQPATSGRVLADPAMLEAELGYTGPSSPPSRVTRLAAYGDIRREGRVLLCRIASGELRTGSWTLPGGGPRVR